MDNNKSIKLNLQKLKQTEKPIYKRKTYWNKLFCCYYNSNKKVGYNAYADIMTPRETHFLSSTYTPRQQNKCIIS